jgi:hypothetical protein
VSRRQSSCCDWSGITENYQVSPALPRQSRNGDLSDDLARGRTSGSLRMSNPYCRVDGRTVPSRFVFLCTRKQTGNPTETNFPISQTSIISWTAWCPTPSCAAISLNVILRSCLMSSSTFPCCAQLQQLSDDHSAADRRCPCFHPLKCVIHLLTLLTPMQASPYRTRSRS